MRCNLYRDNVKSWETLCPETRVLGKAPFILLSYLLKSPDRQRLSGFIHNASFSRYFVFGFGSLDSQIGELSSSYNVKAVFFLQELTGGLAC